MRETRRIFNFYKEGRDMIGENKIQKKKTKGIKCVRRKKNKNDRKRKEHRINEDSKDPIMEETYITLNYD